MISGVAASGGWSAAPAILQTLLDSQPKKCRGLTGLWALPYLCSLSPANQPTHFLKETQYPNMVLSSVNIYEAPHVPGLVLRLLAKSQWPIPRCPILADLPCCGFSINHRPVSESSLSLLTLKRLHSAHVDKLWSPWAFLLSFASFGSWALHYEVFSSTVGFYLSTPVVHPLLQLWQPESSPDFIKCPLGGELPMVENNHFRGATQLFHF